MRALYAALLILGAASTAGADTRGARWVRERGSLEWLTASGGWRTGLGLDTRVPGFDAVGGGTELVVGLDVYGPLGIVLDGRFLGGVQRGGEFLEGLGGVGLQLRLSEAVRLRAGGAAGQALNRDEVAVMVGGWLAASVDLFSLGSGRLAMAIALRLDVDALLGAKKYLPDQSLALSLGLGLRY